MRYNSELKKPNIILVIVDDMGWKDMGCAGSMYYETPNIDALAKDGMRFENGYSAAPLCAPSRGAIFSGKYPARTKFTTVFNGKAASDDRLYEESKKRDGGANNQNYEALHRHNVPSSELFFAETMKDAGYATGFFGKWHCGIGEDYTPDKRGFEVAVGYRNKHVPTSISGHWGKTFKPYGVGMHNLKDDQYVADALTDECINFVRNNKKKPFLAVLSYYLVHDPIQAKPEWVERFKDKATSDQDNPEYAAMLASVDENVGRLVSELQKMGIEKNTLVVFTSDNGGLNKNTSNYPLLGGKSYAFEAAMRVPLIVKWPAVVKPGQISQERVIGMDFYPTFLDVAGIDLKPEQHTDGISFLPVLKGKQNAKKRSLLFHFPHYTGSTSPFSSIIEDDFKLIHFYNDETGANVLFNLSEDPSEQNDLSKEKQDLTIRLARLLENRLKEADAEMPIPNPHFQPDASNLSNFQSNYNKANRDREIQKRKIGNAGRKDGFLSLEKSLIELNKQKIQSGDSSLLITYQTLLQAANKICETPPPSVMDKRHVPPSGNKHDYMSLGRYWWPNPKTDDGLPYIRKDGYSNPELNEYDRPALGQFINGVKVLSKAYYFSGKEKYAKKLTTLLKTWFLNPETRMNPNLQYGQAIKGRVEGRDIGIIDTRDFAFIPDALKLIEDSESYSPKLEKQVKEWLSEYLNWLWTSDYGKGERSKRNNHGTAYDYQVVCLAAFVGRPEIVDSVLREVPEKRIFPQIKADGRQPRELARTRSYSYSVFNIDNFMELVVVAKKLGVDLLEAQGPDGQSLLKAVDYLIPFVKGEKDWPYEQITPIEQQDESLYRILNIVAWQTQDSTYSDLARRIAPDRNMNFESNLVFPLFIN